MIDCCRFVVGNIDPLKTAFLHIGSIQSNSAVPHQTCATGEALRLVITFDSLLFVNTRKFFLYYWKY